MENYEVALDMPRRLIALSRDLITAMAARETASIDARSINRQDAEAWLFAA